FEFEKIDRKKVFEFFARRLELLGFGFVSLVFLFGLLSLLQLISQSADSTCEKHERPERKPWDQAHETHDAGCDHEGLRLHQELFRNFLREVRSRCCTSDDDTCGSRDDQSWDLGDEAVPDRQK